ncbi:SAM-dependent methyltransferase [Halanaeroarchaeum sp. HSR-CO]|uniref:class I SAM-dependent methyltransferase n=1 Tax=Halanaeroarchaeum sp. HSR-CO TaxID=2866382 RepID=UPI00217D75B9|nr:class I SAM-dependent methyltransferase [Halanaeroarchaeum sp. HSR-CO]UWG47672.1 SAM-dependent methyltransferase [Halanaeroarchaeum sp. HSR-CO]
MDEQHTFDADAAESLEEVVRYRYLSRDELVGALNPTGDEDVVDLGSGTGFYTRDVAPYVGTVRAVDLQPEMHEHFRAEGVPDNVEVVSAGIAEMPFGDSTFDAAYSTMTFHEIVSEASLAAVRRVLRPGARFVVVDWSAEGEGERGPPLTARYGPEQAAQRIEDAGFEVKNWSGRPETFLVVAAVPT